MINNDDGILVTDDVGPTHGNAIADNYVAHNIYECGIVLASHNPFSVTATPERRSPTRWVHADYGNGGVYGNLVDPQHGDRQRHGDRLAVRWERDPTSAMFALMRRAGRL